MKLYYTPGACSMASHIMLKELNMDAQYESVDLKAHKTQKGEDYYQINPKGYVPALAMDKGGTLLTESSAVLFYLSEQKPSPGVDRYRLLEWLVFISTELHKTFSPLFNPAIPQEAAKLAKEKLAKRFDLIDKHLAGRQFILDPGFSAPDAYLFTILNWAPKFNIDLSPWKNISEFVKRTQARPAVQAAMREEGLIKS